MKQSGHNTPESSPSYELAVFDHEFLRREEMRSLRFSMEFSKTDLVMRDWGIASTIVCFGSARVRSEDDALRLLQQAEASGSEKEFERARDTLKRSRWYEDAREFARIASERGGAMRPYGRDRHNVIATGGGPGIMEAANRGAYEAGAPSIGFSITLPHEQGCNPYITPALSFRFHYFNMRKMHMAMRAAAVVCFPGGIGTLDELFEVFCLRQTGKSHKFPILLYGRDYWNKVFDLAFLVHQGMMDREDADLICFADSPQEAWQTLLEQGIKLPDE